MVSLTKLLNCHIWIYFHACGPDAPATTLVVSKDKLVHFDTSCNRLFAMEAVELFNVYNWDKAMSQNAGEC